MKNAADASDEALYRACLTWDVPALLDSKSEDAQIFLRALRLQPSSLDESAPPKRMSPLYRAGVGLYAELGGNPTEAREHYAIVAKRPGMKGLLGLCLLAWMQDSQKKDFERVEKRLAALSGRGSRDLAARIHCKLTSWALERGWRELAQAHYDKALRLSNGDLQRTLEEVGNRFGREQRFYFGPRSGRDTTSYRWIRSHLNGAAVKAVEGRLKTTIRSPWTRTWGIGGGGQVEGYEVVAAELQADWAGAHWLLPEIQRVHAALILDNSNKPYDVARAIGLWVRGTGGSVPRLIEAFEGSLSEEAVATLVHKELHMGLSVTRRDTWREVCQALWDEIPDDVVETLLREYEPDPSDSLDLHSEGAKDLGLVAQLLMRRGEVLPYVRHLPNQHLAALVRLLPNALVARVERNEAEQLLAASSDVPGADWESVGWENLAGLWEKLTGPERSLWRARLGESVPMAAHAAVAQAAPTLLEPAVLRATVATYIAHVQGEVERAEHGTFSGGGTSPMTTLARLMLALGQADPKAIEALVSVATSSATSSDQRYAALTALLWLAEGELLGLDQVDAVGQPVPINSFMSDNAAGDQRLDDLARLAVLARLTPDERFASAFLSGARDPDARARHVSIRTMSWLALSPASGPSATTDAALLGALYDPEPGVQAAAVPAIWEATFANDDVQTAALDRLLAAWPTAHRQLRMSIASRLHFPARHEAYWPRVNELARSDRSWQVRWAAEVPQ